MKKLTFIMGIIFLLLLLISVSAWYSEEYNTWTENFDFVIGWFNGTHFKVDDNIDVDGNVSADYFLGNGSLMNSNIWNETAGKVYCANDDCNVGIGTATPQELLHVGAGTDASGLAATKLLVTEASAVSLAIRNSASDNELYLYAADGFGNIGMLTNDDLRILTNNLIRIFVDKGGNTGFLNTSPDHTVSVNGDSYFGGNQIITEDKWVGMGESEERIIFDGSSGYIRFNSTNVRMSKPGSIIVEIGTDDGNNPFLYFSQDDVLKAAVGYRDSTDNLVFYESGADRLEISGGDVGIGTDTPLAKLNVNGDLRVGYTGDRIQMDNLVANKMRIKSFSASLQLGSGYDGIYFTDSSDATVMRIQDDGNIGIGTDTPGTNVQVSGGTDARAYSSSSSSTAAPWAIDNGTVVYIKSDKASVNNSAAYLGLSSKTSGSQTAISYIGNVAGTGSGTDIIGNAMVFGFRTDGASNYNERMRLTNEGNVGIGTTTPKNNLQIADTIQLFETGSGAPSVLNLGRNIYNDGAWKRIIADNDAQLYQQPADTTFRWYQATDANVAADSAVTLTERMRIDAGGYVGIGVTAPDEKLHVYDATEDTRIEVGSGNNNARVVINAGTASKFSILNLQHEGIDYWNVGSDGENDQNFYIYSFNKTGGGDRVLSIDNEGYTGIGTTLPSHKLNVVGDVNITDRIFANLSHVFGLATKVHTVDVANTWYNITMNRTHADSTGFPLSDDNVTIIIPHGGHYSITFGMGVLDTAVSPSAHVAMRVVANEVEIEGSYIEVDTATQGSDYWMERTTHSVELMGGDEIRLQYISADTSVTIDQHDTWATTPFVASGYIQEIISDLE